MGWYDADDTYDGKPDRREIFWRQTVDFQQFAPSRPSRQMFRAIATYPDNHIRSIDNNPQPQQWEHDNNDLWPRDVVYASELFDPTWKSVYTHLTWREEHTPFISFFSKFDMALRWKDHFIRAGADSVRILCYNTGNVLGKLLDANELAKELELNSLERLGKKHYDEYLIYGGMSGEHCAGVYEFFE